MKVTILREAGYEEAMLGLSLSYNADPSRMPARATKLAHKDGGHNKFLESIAVWLDVTAPRYWWSQMDTYRCGISKQSESTMHTLMKGLLGKPNFEGEDLPQPTINNLNAWIKIGDFEMAKKMLPESFLQRRIVATNYKNIRHIVAQRHGHKLNEWQVFCDALRGLEHRHFIFGGEA